MTELQHMMLCVCFGAVAGTMVGSLVSIIGFVVSDLKAKYRKRKEKKTASKAE